MNSIVIVRGAGDLATGIAHRLYVCGFKVLMTEIEKPLVVRRFVSFANSISDGKTGVEGVHAIKADNIESIYNIWNNDEIPVLIDKECKVLEGIKPFALIDAILAKRNTGTNRDMAPITIGVGPGFEAGADVDAVVETKRGHYLGKVIYKGSAAPDTGSPGSIMGYSDQRLLRASASGIIKNVLEIGNMVKTGDVIANIEGVPVRSSIDGVLRGLIANGTEVSKDMKIGDVDPRGIKEYCYTISDKSRAVAGGVLEAVLALGKDKFGI